MKNMSRRQDFREGKILLTLSQIDLFMSKIDKKETCWIWTGQKDSNGYGRCTVNRIVASLAHVVSYVLHKGPIIKGLDILHSCDNPSCVNPDHLRMGTHKENMNDRDSRGRSKICPPRKGVQSNFAKLTDNSVIEIRKCFSMGVKQIDLAVRFNVGASCINSIVKNKTWKHLIQ